MIFQKYDHLKGQWAAESSSFVQRKAEFEEALAEGKQALESARENGRAKVRLS